MNGQAQTTTIALRKRPALILRATEERTFLAAARATFLRTALAAMLSGKTIMRSRGKRAPAPVLAAAGETSDEKT